LAQANDEIFGNTISAVVVVFGMQIHRAAAERDFDDQLRSSLDVVIGRRAGLSAELGQNPEIKVGLRLTFLTKKNCRVVGRLEGRRLEFIGIKQSSELKLSRAMLPGDA